MKGQCLSPLDPSSYSRPELARISHISFNLIVNFDTKTLSGHAILTGEKVEPSVNDIILDTNDLIIHKILNDETKEELQYTISEPVGEFGQKLSIKLPQNENNGFVLNIIYETSSKASGLQWLTPDQTIGKKHPYLFSQFQAIHARSALPCQDTPAVKVKYAASISAPKDMTVLMSAIPQKAEEKNELLVSHFVQDVPVPSYLIALAVGVLESRKIGPRSHVWAEKEIVEECAYEFADTEKQLQTAEDICGPYVWGIYDLLILPPSFPFGGMENPCLTFVTPTLLAGDRSLANVVAHEISHSWTGNLITNRNFEHFWLNEGFTVFIERKIKGRLSSRKDQDFDAYKGVSDLKDTTQLLGNNSPLTKLVVDLKGVHPDDAFSSVPYEKGYTFLRYLETVVGGPNQFEPFIRKYFDNFKYKSIDTDDFKKYFENYFASNPDIATIDWNNWLYSPGLPPIIPNYDISLVDDVRQLKDKFINWDGNGEIPVTMDNYSKLYTSQRIYLLQELVNSKPQSIEKLQQLGRLCGFNEAKNAEIKFRWLRICLKSHWDVAVDATLKWINVLGRMKYVRPLYRDLYDWEAVRQKAIDNYLANKKYMMHVVAYTLAKDLHLSE